jgi:hypothetical protein
MVRATIAWREGQLTLPAIQAIAFAVESEGSSLDSVQVAVGGPEAGAAAAHPANCAPNGTNRK